MPNRKIFVPVMISLALVGGCSKSTTSTGSATGGAASATATHASASAGASASASPSSAASASASDSASASASASPGSSACPSSNTTAFAKTKFVAHVGLAFGAFHRYLYKPLRAGTFTTGTKTHRVLVFAKAGATALFIKRELRLAIDDVQANPTLCSTIAAPLGSLSANIAGFVDQLKGGDTSGIATAEKAVTSIESAASGGGVPITENDNAPVG